MREEWKPVRNYEGLYEVSNMGRVKSLNYNKTGKERILKGVDSGIGYLKVVLCTDGRVKQYLVHRLVAQAFLENPQNLPMINHKDEVKSNNCVQNLEWCSASYNNSYNDKSKKAGMKLSKPVFSVDRETGLIMWWQSANEAERCTGIKHGDITKCCQGKRNSAGNHIWFYAD